MEMRPGREPCLAEITNDLALPHMGAFGRATGKPGHVIIRRDIAIGVLDLDTAAVARVPPRLDDGAAAGREDRRADRGGPIDTGMRARIAEDRVEP